MAAFTGTNVGETHNFDPSENPVDLAGGIDTLLFGITDANLSAIAVTNTEILQAGVGTSTKFTVDEADLVSGGSILGNVANDTLIITGTAFDVSSVTLSSVEILKAATAGATTFTVDQNDLAQFGSIVGSNASDILVANGTLLDLSSTSLSSVEALKAGKAVATTFIVDSLDVAGLASITGSSGADTLQTASASLDLRNTALSSVDILKGQAASSTEFFVNQVDLASGGSVIGGSAVDTLVVASGENLDLTSTTLTSVEIIENVGAAPATKFTVDQADLASGGSVIGDANPDTLVINGTSLNLTSTVLSSVEILQAGKSAATTFTVNQDDIHHTGQTLTSVVGSTSANDTLVTVDSALDLRSTALTSVEILKAGTAGATEFTVNQADLASGGSVIGSSASDTLTVASGENLDLTSTTLTSVETIKASTGASATKFTVDQADLAAGGSVVGASNTDTLVINGTSLNLTSTTLSNVEVLQAGKSAPTTFIVDQADLITGGQVLGNSGADTVTANGTQLDLTGTILSSVEILQATKAGTTFIVNQSDVTHTDQLLTDVKGVAGNDTLQTSVTQLDLTSTALTSVDILKAGNASATTFTVDQADLASGGSVVGNNGVDLLVINGSSLNLGSTTLSSVEILKAGLSTGTTFTVDQADLATTNGQVVGHSSAADTLAANGTLLDLTSTFLSSVEILLATKAATTFIVDMDDLHHTGQTLTDIKGSSSGNDTLQASAADALLNLTSTTLSSVEILKAATGTPDPTIFTLDQADLAAGGSVIGGGGSDVLVIASGDLDLTHTTLTSVEIIENASGAAATKFTVDQADLASGGQVKGDTNTDTLVINGTLLNLSSTTLSSVEVLQAGKAAATTFIVNGAGSGDLKSGGAVIGSSGTDTLQTVDTGLILTSTTLTNVEILKAGTSSITLFEVDQNDLAAGGSVIGSSSTDTLAVTGTDINLTSTTLTSVEQIENFIGVGATKFTVDQADLAAGGSVTSNTTATDTLVINGTSLNLASTTLNSIDVLQAGKSVATTFIVDQADLANGGSVIGSTGNDTLQAQGALLDLSSTGLSSVEILKAGSAAATTFIVNTMNGDLATGGSVIGGAGVDTLQSADSIFTLSSTTLTSIEILKAGNTNDSLITVDQADLASGGSVIGNVGSDTLQAQGVTLNLASTTLTSIEKLQAGSLTGFTTFTVDQADLASAGTGGSVIGNNGNDILAANGTRLDLTSTTLTSVEILQATKAATTFIVNQADLASSSGGGSVTGSTGNDTLQAADTQLDLTSTVVTSVEILKAGNAGATTFSVNQNDLAHGGSVIGTSANNDTLVTADSELDLSSTTLSSVEILKSTHSNTTFTVDQADLAAGGSVVGSGGLNYLAANGTILNLSSTTLSSIRILEANNAAATTFIVDQDDLASGGSVVGNDGKDTLIVNGTSFDLSHTFAGNVEILKAQTSNSTTFTVNQADLDLANGGSVIIGSSSNDTLVTADTELDLSSTTLTSIETLKAGTTFDTTFTVDQNDLGLNGSVVGSSGSDTLSTVASALNLSSTALTSVEKLLSTNATGTTFTLDQSDISALQTITGSTGSQDAVVFLSSVIDLSSTAMSGIETLKAGLNIATTITVNQADLATGGAVIGSSGSDSLVAADTQLNLSSTTLTSVEVLRAGNTNATTFTVDQADLASGGSVIGNNSNDTLTAAGTLLDLTSTTLSSVEKLATANTTGTTFKLDATDLASVTSVAGSVGADTLIVTSTAFDVSGKSISGIETLQAAIAGTTFTVADPTAFSAIGGTTGNDTLVSNAVAFDLSGTTLSSVEILKAAPTNGATTFKLNQADLASGGSVIGTGNNDIILAQDTQLNLSSTTLSSVEVLTQGNAADTVFTVDQADLASGGSVIGSAGKLTLAANGTQLDLTSTTLSSVEVLQATKAATTFIVNQADLLSGGSVVGGAGNDTLALAATETALDLRSTTLSSVEILKALNGAGVTFTVDQTKVGGLASVLGSNGTDTLASATTALNLGSTTLSSVEILSATQAGTIFTVDQADLASGGSVLGTIGGDTLLANGTSLDLSSTMLTSVETLKAGKSAATTFIVDGDTGGDLAAGGSVVGSSGNDTLQSNDGALTLTSTTLTSVEILKGAATRLTEFFVNQADLASGGSVIGGSGVDTLRTVDTELDLRNTTLTSVEILKTGNTNGTTFSVDQADLVSGGSVLGSTNGTSGTDILVINGTSLNLASTGLSSVETLQAGKSVATTFIVDQADLASGGSVVGSSGNDTLQAQGTQLNLASTGLTSVEILKAGVAATTITVNQNDLVTGGSVAGGAGVDTLATADTQLDLRSTTLTSIEILKAGTASNTTFTVDPTDLVSGGSVVGSSGTDTLQTFGTALNLASTSLSSVDKLVTQNTIGTTFTVDQADLAAGGSVLGSGGADVLASAGTSLDFGLSSTTLSSVETLQATKGGTLFTLGAANKLGGLATVLGSTGNDTLATSTTSLDLSSITLSSVEILKATQAATTFIVDQADLASTGGSVLGTTGNDTLQVNGTLLDLTSTTLTSVEILKAGNVAATTFKVDQADLASGGSVIGSTASDTLLANGTLLDLSSTTLSSIETLQSGKSTATTFIVNQADVASSGGNTLAFIRGNSSATDTLVVADTQLDLSSTALSSIEILKAGRSGATTFTVNGAADLASGGSVVGSSGVDTLATVDITLDLRSTTLTSVEILKTGNTNGTTFSVDQADLVSGGSVLGSTNGTSGTDILVINGTSLNLASTGLSSVETLQAGKSVATTFIVDQADLASGGSVVGSSGNDTLQAQGTQLNLASTGLTSVEILKAGVAATTITVNQNDLVTGGSVAGGAGVDTLATADTQLDLRSTALTSIEILKAGNAGATTFTVDQADLASGGSVIGTVANNDTLQTFGATLNLGSTTLSSVEILKTSGAATIFTVDQADLATTGGSVVGSNGSDTLQANGASLNLTSTTLSSVDILQATKAATTFTVDPTKLGVLASVVGSTGNDTLVTVTNSLDLSSIALSSVEILKAGNVGATTFKVDQADLASTGGSVLGSSGTDILLANGSTLNLTSTTLSSVEILQTANAATTFTVDQADLAAGGSVVGSGGTDVLVINGTSLDLSNTTLSSVNILQAGKSSPTTFIVNGNTGGDLLSGGSVVGSSGNDTLITKDGALNLTGTTLSSVEILKAGLSTATTFTVNTAVGASDLASGGSVIGSSGVDTLVAGDSAMNLTSTTLTSVEILQTSNNSNNSLTLDQADLASGGSVIGSNGNDVLVINGTSLNLASTTLTSVEVLEAGTTAATTFIVDQADLASAGTGSQVVGVSGKSDTLQAQGTQLDLTSTALFDVEILKAGSSLATTFTVNQGDLSGGSVSGSSGVDTLVAADTQLNLGGMTLSSVEILKAGNAGNTTFTVDQADLASGGSVLGTTTGTDTLTTFSTTLDLTSTTLTSVEKLTAGSGAATQFILDQDDLAHSGQTVTNISGSSGTDILVAAGTSLDLSSTFLSNVEILQATKAGTVFTVNQSDLNSSGGVITDIIGTTGNDTLLLAAADSQLDLTSTTLTSVEILKTGNAAATNFIVDQADLLAGGSVIGSSGNDALVAHGAGLDLTGTMLTSVEVLKATVAATTFTVDQADLLAGGSVLGTTGTDLLVIHGTSLDLTATTLSSVEILQAGTSNATTFLVDQADLASAGGGGSVVGSSGNDTLFTHANSLDLSSTALTSVETLKSDNTGGTTFTVDQGDLASGGSVIGETGGGSTLIVNGNSIDLSSTTLTNIETIHSANSTAASTFTIGGGEGGATLDLINSNKHDTIDLAAAYRVTDATSDDTIGAHTLTIDNFTDGATAGGGDTINLSAIEHGAPATHIDITGYIALSSPATLKAALDIAATADGSATSAVVSFQYAGDTYVLVDNSASHALTADDAVVKLTGLHTLTDGANLTF